MKDPVWKTLSVISCLCLLSACAVSFGIGGCGRQLITSEGGTCYMSCYWCFRASGMLAALGALSCLIQVFVNGAAQRRGIALVSALAALGTILLNTTPIIGICNDTSMVCHQTALAVNILSVVCIVACLVCIIRPVSHADRPKMGL